MSVFWDFGAVELTVLFAPLPPCPVTGSFRPGTGQTCTQTTISSGKATGSKDR